MHIRSLALLLTFALAGGVVIAALRAPNTQPPTLNYLVIGQYAILIILVGGLIYLIARRKFSAVWWEALLTLTVFLGVWLTLLLILPLSAALILASFLTLAEIFWRNTALHNLLYLLGSAGVALNFAGWIPGEVLVVGLVLFIVYDMLAGSPGGPIAELAQKLIVFGVIPGFVLPARFSDLGRAVDTAVRSDAALLGAGDIILPLSLVARASFLGRWEAFLVLLGALAGAAVFMFRRDLHPRDALLPLAVGAAVPFIIVQFIL